MCVDRREGRERVNKGGCQGGLKRESDKGGDDKGGG